MTSTKYLSCFSLLLLLACLFTPLAASSQPPIVFDTLYVGQTAWGPWSADPVMAYDSESGELIMNVYDTLIAMKDEVYWEFIPRLSANVPVRGEITKTVTSTDVNLADPTGSNWSDGSVCLGWVDNYGTGYLQEKDTLYLYESDGSYRTWFVQTFDAGPPVSVTLWRGKYVFHTRTDPTVSFFNETGQVVDTFDVYDAEYSFKRGLVQDPYGTWMYYKPFFDQIGSDPWDPVITGDNSTTMILAHLIDNAVEVSGNDLVINVGIPYPDTAFKQMLSQTWGSIVSREFSLSIGCWNGDLYTDSNGDGMPDWWTTVHRLETSPYDMANPWRYVGSGPYRVTLFDQQNNLVRLSRNPTYWLGWPASGAKGYLETIEIRYILFWLTRWEEFSSCNLDMAPVNVPSLLMPTEIPPNIKIITNLRSLSFDYLLFTFTINSTSDFIGSGRFPDGVPTTFFNNTHVRRAFAYALNRTRLPELLSYMRPYGNSYRETSRPTPLIRGLYPDYHTGIGGYDIDYDLAEAELKSAVFDGQNVWDTGFNLTIPYPGDYYYDFFASIRNFFSQLSTYDGRSPALPGFTINLDFMPSWGVYLSYWTTFKLPIMLMGWLSDLADADNLIRLYMHSEGDFSRFSNYTTANGWGSRKDELIDLAVKTPDGPERAAMYAELEQIYIDDCPSVPLTQTMHREFLKYWVKGWYYNPVYPSDYYYHLWKEDTCWADITGQTPEVSDGIANMRDIGYVCDRFGAKAPDPARNPPLDPKWGNGTYGLGCADVYGDRKVDMRDIGEACAHFGDRAEP